MSNKPSNQALEEWPTRFAFTLCVVKTRLGSSDARPRWPSLSFVSLDGMSVLKRKRDKGELACGIVLAPSGVRYASDVLQAEHARAPLHLSWEAVSLLVHRRGLAR